MKKIIVLLVGSFMCASCSLFFGNSDPEWNYEKDAIELRLKSDQDLNLYKGKAHSLIVCVYHLKDLNGFNQLADERDGLYRLLACGRSDSGMTYARRVIVQPGKDVKEIMDRTEGAKYVGIVAGYYGLEKEDAVRVCEVPLSFFDNPEKLLINLDLGSQGIKEIKTDGES